MACVATSHLILPGGPEELLFRWAFPNYPMYGCALRVPMSPGRSKRLLHHKIGEKARAKARIPLPAIFSGRI